MILKKMLVKRFFLSLIVVILVSQLVVGQGCSDSGFMGRFDPSTNITITETCPTCTFINITIKDPDSNIIVENQPMNLTNNLFNYTVADTLNSKNGTYFVEGYSNLDNPFKACYDVNQATEINTGESVVYFILVILSFFLFGLSLWGAIVLPFSNKIGNLGRVLDITWVKYFKLSLIVVSYLMFIWIINLSLTLTNNLISLNQFNGFFTMIFNILMASVWPFFVVMFLFFNVSMIKDLKLNKLLSRGINPR